MTNETAVLVNGTWVVSVTMTGPSDKDIEQVASKVRDTRGLRSSGVFAMGGSVFARMEIEARTAAAAVVLIDDLLLDVVGDSWIPVAMVVESKAEFDAGGLCYVPALAGLAEAASILGLTEAEAVLATQDPTFPSPIGELACGPIWTRAEVETFARICACRQSRRKLSLLR
jgi:hypothetical protein